MTDKKVKVAVVLLENGGTITVIPDNGTDFSLGELKKHIGCEFVERLVISKTHELWLDERGKLMSKPVNYVASSMAATHMQPGWCDYLVGNVLLCERGMVL